MERLPASGEVERKLLAAADAVAAAQTVRRRLRRRTRRHDPERQKKIHRMIRVLVDHGGVLRSELKRSDHHDRPYTPTHRRAFKRLLAQLRYERRQLAKMLPVDELT
jgi:uncharacterized UPF0160 family protein